MLAKRCCCWLWPYLNHGYTFFEVLRLQLFQVFLGVIENKEGAGNVALLVQVNTNCTFSFWDMKKKKLSSSPSAGKLMLSVRKAKSAPRLDFTLASITAFRVRKLMRGLFFFFFEAPDAHQCYKWLAAIQIATRGEQVISPAASAASLPAGALLIGPPVAPRWHQRLSVVSAVSCWWWNVRKWSDFIFFFFFTVLTLSRRIWELLRFTWSSNDYVFWSFIPSPGTDL